jgi:hypothetical protein
LPIGNPTTRSVPLAGAAGGNQAATAAVTGTGVAKVGARGPSPSVGTANSPTTATAVGNVFEC